MSQVPEKLIPANDIRVLPEGLANRIAAGEVVERPASVVKELIENSLDAEATEITIGVKNAGFDELLIADNGWGMDADDVVLALRRHATSKIKSAEDLLRITHLGFRGEALPSIASVSRVEVTSRRQDRSEGVIYKVDGGKSKDPEPISHEAGTTIRVRSMFYNVPARRKFMRTPATEYGHIVQAVRRYALAYPEIHWKLLKDDEIVWDLAPTDLNQRVVDIFGDRVNKDDLHEVSTDGGSVKVHGLIGGTSLFRKSRGDQFFFINRRPFQSTNLNHAVVNGFGPLIYPGQSPFYVLFLRLDPEEFDVNVHPAKHEVRFRDEGGAYKSVLLAIRDALGTAIRTGEAPVKMVEGSLRTGMTPSHYQPQGTASGDGREDLRKMFGKPPTDDFGQSRLSMPARKAEYRVPPPPAIPIKHDHDTQTGAHEENQTGSSGDAMISSSESSAPTILHHDSSALATENAMTERINVWQLHRTYILSQVKSGLVIIDQHVAHERILFERALAAMQNRPWSAQQILLPVRVTLDPEDSALLSELAPQLEKMGLEVENFGGTDWQIRSHPSGVRVRSEEKLLRDILADYRSSHGIKLKPEETLAASFACKAAIKKGDPLNLEEMNQLIDELFQTEYPFVCPHGRPVVVNLTISELNKMFGRE